MHPIYYAVFWSLLVFSGLFSLLLNHNVFRVICGLLFLNVASVSFWIWIARFAENVGGGISPSLQVLILVLGFLLGTSLLVALHSGITLSRFYRTANVEKMRTRIR